MESVARQVVETAETEQATGVTESQWWGARGSLFEKLGRYPTLESIWRSGGYDRPEEPREFGLQRVLAGIEGLIRSRGARLPPPERDGPVSRQLPSGQATGSSGG